MMSNTILAPHGGGVLVDRLLPEVEKEQILSKSNEFKVYNITNSDLSLSDIIQSPIHYKIYDEHIVTLYILLL